MHYLYSRSLNFNSLIGSPHPPGDSLLTFIRCVLSACSTIAPRTIMTAELHALHRRQIPYGKAPSNTSFTLALISSVWRCVKI